MATLVEKLDALSRPGWLFEPGKNEAVRCTACAHRCMIKSGSRGICQMRSNLDGQLMVPWGYVAGVAVDPIEK